MSSKNRLKFLPIDKNGIPLTEVILAHKQYQSIKCIRHNLGDGFLFETNPIFRTIRERFLAANYSFTMLDRVNYYSFPLMSLDNILNQKKIPYRNNFIWIEILNEKIPKFTLTELKKCELHFNYILHDSAHFVAHEVLFGKKRMSNVPINKKSLLKILLGEAFANTTECFAALYSEGEISSYFLDANCYFRLSAKEIKLIQKSVEINGFHATFLTLLFSFLYSNYLYTKPSKNILAQIGTYTKLKNPSVSLMRIPFQLSEIFRSNTTQMHLMKLGFQKHLNKWIAIDPVAYIRKTPELTQNVNQLCGVYSSIY